MTPAEVREVTLFWHIASELRHAVRTEAHPCEIGALVDEMQPFIDYTTNARLRERGLALLHSCSQRRFNASG